jgi:flagellar biogenesis protein FliO
MEPTLNISQNSSEKIMMDDSKGLLQLLFIIFIEYLFRIFILTPVAAVKRYSRHPISILFMFLFLFPIYLFTQCAIYVVKYMIKIASLPRSQQYLYILNVFFGSSNNDWVARESHHQQVDTEDDMQQWLERCSICFESKLDLCLDNCRDQFCLECFQKFVLYLIIIT